MKSAASQMIHPEAFMKLTAPYSLGREHHEYAAKDLGCQDERGDK